jgi:hypothetical protein
VVLVDVGGLLVFGAGMKNEGRKMAPWLVAQTLLLISLYLATYQPAAGRSLTMIEA